MHRFPTQSFLKQKYIKNKCLYIFCSSKQEVFFIFKARHSLRPARYFLISSSKTQKRSGIRSSREIVSVFFTVPKEPRDTPQISLSQQECANERTEEEEKSIGHSFRPPQNSAFYLKRIV